MDSIFFFQVKLLIKEYLHGCSLYSSNLLSSCDLLMLSSVYISVVSNRIYLQILLCVFNRFTIFFIHCQQHHFFRLLQVIRESPTGFSSNVESIYDNYSQELQYSHQQKPNTSTQKHMLKLVLKKYVFFPHVDVILKLLFFSSKNICIFCTQNFTFNHIFVALCYLPSTEFEIFKLACQFALSVLPSFGVYIQFNKQFDISRRICIVALRRILRGI